MEPDDLAGLRREVALEQDIILWRGIAQRAIHAGAAAHREAARYERLWRDTFDRVDRNQQERNDRLTGETSARMIRERRLCR